MEKKDGQEPEKTIEEKKKIIPNKRSFLGIMHILAITENPTQWQWAILLIIWNFKTYKRSALQRKSGKKHDGIWNIKFFHNQNLKITWSIQVVHDPYWYHIQPMNRKSEWYELKYASYRRRKNSWDQQKVGIGFITYRCATLRSFSSLRKRVSKLETTASLTVCNMLMVRKH